MSKASQVKPVFGWKAKLRNRRVIVHGLQNGEVGITWIKLENGVPVKTKTRLTREAAMATAELILKVLSNKTFTGVSSASEETYSERTGST